MIIIDVEPPIKPLATDVSTAVSNGCNAFERYGKPMFSDDRGNAGKDSKSLTFKVDENVDRMLIMYCLQQLNSGELLKGYSYDSLTCISAQGGETLTPKTPNASCKITGRFSLKGDPNLLKVRDKERRSTHRR